MARVAFNVFDMSSIQAVNDAAIEAELPVYMQFSASTVRYFGAKKLRRLLAAEGVWENSLVNVHLDHCADCELIRECLESGWHSIMADFSDLPIDENIRRTNEIHKLCEDFGADLEAELGAILGEEDGFTQVGSGKVTLDDVAHFSQRASFQLLAIGIGNAHGLYSSTDGVDYDLFKSVHMSFPNLALVLHGASGLPESRVQELCDFGLAKINISTDLKNVYRASISQTLVSAKSMNMIEYQKRSYLSMFDFAKSKIEKFK